MDKLKKLKIEESIMSKWSIIVIAISAIVIFGISVMMIPFIR